MVLRNKKNWNIVVLGGYKERNIHTDRHHIEIIKKNFLPSFKHNRNVFVVVVEGRRNVR